MTKLNILKAATASTSEKAQDLTSENKVLLGRVQQLESSLQAGLDELKRDLLGNKDEDSKPQNVEECIQRITSFELRALAQISEVKSEIVSTEKKLNDLRQELLLNNIVVHGVKEKKGTVTRPQNDFCEMVIKNLGIHITPSDIDYCYRLGPPQENRNRPLLVAFINRWLRNDVFNSKRLLKGTGMLIFEHLIYDQLILFRKVRSLVGVRNTWTRRGKVFVVVDDVKKQINDVSELD